MIPAARASAGSAAELADSPEDPRRMPRRGHRRTSPRPPDGDGPSSRSTPNPTTRSRLRASQERLDPAIGPVLVLLGDVPPQPPADQVTEQPRQVRCRSPARCSAEPRGRAETASLPVTNPRTTAWPSRSSSRAVSLRSSTRTSSSRAAGRIPGPEPGRRGRPEDRRQSRAGKRPASPRWSSWASWRGSATGPARAGSPGSAARAAGSSVGLLPMG